MDNKEYVNNLSPYFKMLNNINNDLTKIIRSNKQADLYQNEELFYNITSEILRLMPYANAKTRRIMKLDKESGILLLKNKKAFIKEKYNKILNFSPFYETLKNIIKIRNKYIHEPHNITCNFSVSGTTTCSMGLCYKGKTLSISTISLAPIVYYLNKVFDTIHKEALIMVEEIEEYKEYPYYKTLLNYDFSEKNWNYTILPEYLMRNF